jgi:hypothetical protein
VIVSQGEIDQIRGKMRKRILELPVRRERVREAARHPKTGRALGSPSNARGGWAIKQCPMQVGGIYHLKPSVPHDRYRREADEQPTRARAVLRLIDLYETPTRTVAVTVTEHPERQGDVWLVRFEKGERRELFDSPVFLAKYGDFTMTASKQAIPGDPELSTPFAEDLARARAKALERRVSPQRQLVSKISADVDTLRTSLEAMGKRNRLRRVEHDLSVLAHELSSADAIDCSTTIAGDGPHTDVARHERPLASNSEEPRDADADVVLATSEAA